MKNVHDQNFKDIFGDVLLYIAPSIIDIEVAQANPLPTDFSMGTQKYPDFFHEVIDNSGKKYYVHLEFQTDNHPNMNVRMMQYYALRLYQHEPNVIQKVLYFGNKKCRMKSRFKGEAIDFTYDLIDFRKVDYQYFFQSMNPRQIILSILGDFGKQKAEVILAETIAKIKSLDIETNFKKEALLKLYHLARLRKAGDGKSLQLEFDKIIETMPIEFDIESDRLYQKGMKKGVEEGIEKGREEGREMLIRRLLDKFSPKEVAGLVNEELETIENIQAKYQK